MSQTQTATAIWPRLVRRPVRRVAARAATCAPAKSSPPKSCASTSTSSWSTPASRARPTSRSKNSRTTRASSKSRSATSSRWPSTRVENGYGDTILSRDKAKRLASWMSLENSLDSGEFVTGTVNGKVKGGLTVLVNGIRAFLPGSLLDTRPVKDMSPFEGKTMEFKVIKLDRKRNNVVLSRRAVVEASMGEERAKLLETLHEGAIVHGVVKNITEYGAFVDLGGIDGLLHITDMAWRRVRHPSEVVTVGQELHRQGAEVRRREEPRLAGHQAAGRRPVARRVAPLPAAARACSARSPTSPTTARSSRSSRASKAWCTSPRWTGPTRTSRRPRSCRSATRSRSWCWRSTRTSAASAWA